MIVGERVLERLNACGLSQAALAREVGVAQPTIFKLIHSNKKGSAHLHKVARVLGTTPAYLTGETDDPAAAGPSTSELTFQQRELLDQFSNLSERARSALMVLIGELSAPRGK